MNKYVLPKVDDQPLWDLWLATYWQPSVIAADELGIFDSLKMKPQSSDELAASMKLNSRGTLTLLRLLASLKLLTMQGNQFHLTDYADLYMLKDGSFYWGPMLRFGLNHTKVQKVLIEKLKNSGDENLLRPGHDEIAKDFWMPIQNWAEGSIDIEKASYIAASMHSHSLVAAVKTAQLSAFKNAKKFLDIGGGSGCFSIALAQNHDHLKCTVMELPAMCEVVKRYIHSAQVEERVDTLKSDMFRQAWPEGYDVHFFSNIFHDWTMDTCSWLARQSYHSLPKGGKILIHEMLIDEDGCGPMTTASFSMLMFLTTQGQQFTFSELKSLLEKEGFEDITVAGTHGYYSLVSGIKK